MNGLGNNKTQEAVRGEGWLSSVVEMGVGAGVV